MSAEADRDRLALLVHEVRSPVAALAAIAAALAGDSREQGATRELVSLAVAACLAIDRVVGDAAVGSLRYEDVDLAGIARDAAAGAALGGARVRAIVPAEVPTLRADPLRLRQALDNLVANAIAHSGAEAEVVVRVRVTEAEALVSVEDAGSGVPAAARERIFEPGIRLAEDRPGSGLGLAVARAIVEGHGGTLTLASEPGSGAVFTIALPLDTTS